MRIRLDNLAFTLPKNSFDKHIQKLDMLSEELEELGQKAGTGNQVFNEAYNRMEETVRSGGDLLSTLYSPIMVRALAVSLLSGHKDKIIITKEALQRIDSLRPQPSTLLINNMYQYFLFRYDTLPDRVLVGLWIREAMTKKGMIKPHHLHLLAEDGAQWLAEQAVANNRDFSCQLQDFDLEKYAAGRFLTVAKNIYFVEQLKTIPANAPHPLLNEVQSPKTFETAYSEGTLLGHKILEIIIGRAPATNVDDSWLNVVMAIAGDPRIPTTHPKYLKWWSQLDSSLKQRVMGWLSKLDLRLFLEALENYSWASGKEDLQRMFPSRKAFLEGLEKKELVTHTRLYLSSGAAKYLQKHYKKEHLPQYSIIQGSDRSIIHVQMGDAHMVEGSHSCYLWVYHKLDESAIVFDYDQTLVTYSSLTQELSQEMELYGISHRAKITHTPQNYSWQHKALQSLNEISIDISPEDVLSEDDYYGYKRIYGVGYGA